MNASEHMLEIPEVTQDWSTDQCLELMLDLECFELPICNEGRLIGKVGLEDCILNSKTTVESMVEANILQVYVNTHLFDVMRLFRDGKSDLAAVVDLEDNCLGIITKTMVLNKLSHSISVEQDGAIILLEMASSQYSSSEIAQIVEGENAQILGLWLEQIPDSGRIRASVKVNTNSAERIISSLLRFKYEVITSFGDEDYKERVERRYQAFIKYLDI